jgi:hypothetical protein
MAYCGKLLAERQAPPNYVSLVSGQFLTSGKESRHIDYCRQYLCGSDYLAYQFYPDLVIPPGSEIEPIPQSTREFSKSYTWLSEITDQNRTRSSKSIDITFRYKSSQT